MTNLKGFFKVGEDFGSLYKVRMWNPKTGETKSIVVDDREYPRGEGLIDRSYSLEELDFLKNLEIEEDTQREYFHSLGFFYEGDFVQIVSGRKNKGYTGVITSLYMYHIYSQSIPYTVLDNTIKVQEKHIKLVKKER